MQVVYNLRSTIVMGRLLLLIKHVFCLQDKIHISSIHPKSLHSLLPLSFTETSYRSQTQFISRSEIKKKRKENTYVHSLFKHYISLSILKEKIYYWSIDSCRAKKKKSRGKGKWSYHSVTINRPHFLQNG